MNYYYDVLLNFFDVNTLFYEWDSLDNLEYYKKVPLILVSNKTLKDFINNDVRVSKEFLTLIENKAKKKGESSKYIAIFADRNGSLALEFNDDGLSISRSYLELEDDLNIQEILYSIDISNIDYEIVKKLEYNPNLKDEDNIKRVILTELNNLEKNKEYIKLKYFYMELFNKNPDDMSNIVSIMKNRLNKEIGINERKVYDLIKLSYNKV